MTLSSRDPHLGQRIVWKFQLPYHWLWCQRFFDCFCNLACQLEKSDATTRTQSQLRENPSQLRVLLGVRCVLASLSSNRRSVSALTQRTTDDTRLQMQKRAPRS